MTIAEFKKVVSLSDESFIDRNEESIGFVSPSVDKEAFLAQKEWGTDVSANPYGNFYAQRCSVEEFTDASHDTDSAFIVRVGDEYDELDMESVRRNRNFQIYRIIGKRSHSWRRKRRTSKLVFSTTGIVDKQTKSKLYVTVRSQAGSPTELTLPSSLTNEEPLRKGDFIEYRIVRTSAGLNHFVVKATPPKLSESEILRIEAEVHEALK